MLSLKEQPGFAERLHRAGFRGLLSVVPPGARLTERSNIPQALLGKVPGQKRADGRWSGDKDFLTRDDTLENARQWDADGASIGLRSEFLPGCDIDVTDSSLAAMIEERALAIFGAAPIRVGNAPKRLLMYRTAEPFGRLRLWFTPADGGTKQLVEILGQKGFYVVHGIHQKTGGLYVWNRSPDANSPDQLTSITGEQAGAFLDELERELTVLGAVVVREGRSNSVAPPSEQTSLLAPSFERLRAAVECIPNVQERFSSRDDYLRIGYAIKAAAGIEHDNEGFELFAEWAAKWDGGVNDPEIVHDDWSRMQAPYRVGFGYLAELARGYGFNDAADDFDVVEGAPPGDSTPAHVRGFNRRFALAESMAHTVIVTPDEGGVEFMPYPHWRRIVENERCFVPTKKRGDRTDVPISDEWLKHPKRRTVVGVVCDPTLPALCDVPSKRRRNRSDFNIWPGFAISPDADKRCDLFLSHLLNIVCRGNSEGYAWLTMWLAGMVQEPARLPGTAAVIHGVPGSGKTLVGKYAGAMIGAALHVVMDGVDELLDRFNYRISGKLLVQGEEVRGTASNLGRIKTLVTASTLRIEKKGVDAYDVENLTHLLLTSNDAWVVHTERGDRRFMFFDSSPDRANDLEYFGAIMHQMEKDGGVAGLLHFLLEDVVVDWDRIARPLATEAVRDQQIASLSADQRWLHDLFGAGALPGDEKGEGFVWRDDLYAEHESFMKSRATGHRVSRETLGTLLRGGGYLADGNRKTRPGYDRQYYYVLQPLAECRALFARGLAKPPEWEEATGWHKSGAGAARLL